MTASRPRILLFGGSGQIGSELRVELQAIGDVIAPSRGEVDLEVPGAAASFVEKVQPRAVVNAAGYTAVDAAETDVVLCERLNAGVVAEILRACRAYGALMVHYSTDYVFDGSFRTPYMETDGAGPLSVYGRTKLAGERAVAESAGEWLVLRTSWVYGGHGRNFLLSIVRAARERPELRIVDDQQGAPTWSRSIARATAQLVAGRMGGDTARGGEVPNGIYHLSAAGSTTWYGFARAIVDELTARGVQGLAAVTPISSAEYPMVATRPAWSVLDSSRLAEVSGISIGDWRAELAEACVAVFDVRAAGQGAGAP